MQLQPTSPRYGAHASDTSLEVTEIAVFTRNLASMYIYIGHITLSRICLVLRTNLETYEHPVSPAAPPWYLVTPRASALRPSERYTTML